MIQKTSFKFHIYDLCKKQLKLNEESVLYGGVSFLNGIVPFDRAQKTYSVLHFTCVCKCNSLDRTMRRQAVNGFPGPNTYVTCSVATSFPIVYSYAMNSNVFNFSFAKSLSSSPNNSSNTFI